MYSVIFIVLQLSLLTYADYDSSGCGGHGVLTASEGYIKSHPAFGSIKYSNHRDCSWNIDAPAGQRIRLETLDNIAIEDHNNCDYDYLSIYDGQDWYAPKLGTWCGSGTIPTILSSTRYLYIEFITDNTGREDGFKMRYEFFRPDLHTGCYTDEFDCENRICIDKDWRCDSVDDCGDNSDEKNCPTGQPTCKANEFMCTNGECIDQSWRCDGEKDCTDNSDELQCDNVACPANTYKCSAGDCIADSWVCDGEADCDDGSDESDCSSGSCAAYEFHCTSVDKCVPESFVCDGDNDCEDSSDERNCNSTTTTAATVTSTRTPVTTAAVVNGSGCGGPTQLTGSVGVSAYLSSGNYPDNYDKNSFCTWTITVQPNEKIQLNFVDFKLETGSLEAGGSRSCKYDYLSIYESRISIHTLIGRYCGQSAPAPIVSTGNKLVLQFISDDLINKKGFKIHWKAVSGNQLAASGCYGPRDLTASSGTILSHAEEGRQSYPESECVWVIGVSPGTQTTLTFNTFDLESSNACKYDSLKVYLGLSEQSTLAGTYCGASLPGSITSTTGFYLVFKSDDLANGVGFNISYSKTAIIDTTTQAPTTSPVSIQDKTTKLSAYDPEAGCTTLSQITQEGVIQSFNYGNTAFYDTDLDCKWLITAPKDKVVKITFLDFHVEYEVSCGYDDISVYEGTSAKSPLLRRACGDSLPKPVISQSNQVFVQFLTDDDDGYEGFKARISFEDPPAVCKSDEYTCGNGKCIARKYQCNKKDDCGDNSDEIICYNDIGNCGVPSTKYPTKPGNSRVVGGTEANPHSWPWQAYVVYNYFFTCGGTLIHPQWVATAAHCFENRQKRGSMWQVTLGKHKKSWESDAEKVGVAKIFEYPHYDERTTDSDIALIKLDKPVKLTEEVKPICLPAKHRADDTKCYVTGWGDTKGTGYRTVLKQAAVPIINKNTCNSQQWLAGDVSHNMFCAGYPSGTHDGCEGDSGGPLSCEDSGRFHLQGITSWGLGCGLPKMPGVYTLVPNFVDWIRDTIGKNT